MLSTVKCFIVWSMNHKYKSWLNSVTSISPSHVSIWWCLVFLPFWNHLYKSRIPSVKMMAATLGIASSCTRSRGLTRVASMRKLKETENKWQMVKSEQADVFVKPEPSGTPLRRSGFVSCVSFPVLAYSPVTNAALAHHVQNKAGFVTNYPHSVVLNNHSIKWDTIFNKLRFNTKLEKQKS